MPQVLSNKPKLVFFQFKYDRRLPEFQAVHHREHVRCLSEFFDVTVIDDDCDYQQICDTYQPELTIFETGINLYSCRRPKVSNTRGGNKVPKLGFINADAWCETRAGTLSDMDHWDIQTFFSICVTAAEHTPEIADRLFVWPNFIDPEVFRDYDESKIIPVLFTGATAPQYPWRKRVFKLVSRYYPSLCCPHGGYLTRSGAGQVLHGERYARTINASVLVPSCGTIAKEVVRKHFEIPGCRACLVTERSPGLEAAGFVDMQNCIYADEDNVLDKLDHVFQNPEKLRRITDAGYELVHSRHTLKHRSQILEWLILHKTLRPNQKIVQTNPFQPLSVSENSSRSDDVYIISGGWHLSLLRQGDERLSAGEHDNALRSYLACSNYMRRLPEPKLKIALCNLYKGNARCALRDLFEMIQYTLEDYKAIDPDPVEWAYYIISLLCIGKHVEASNRASEFLCVRHEELERARRIAMVLRYGKLPPTTDSRVAHRPSIHRMPVRTFKIWLDEVCTMLRACGQCRSADTLEEFVWPAGPPAAPQDEVQVSQGSVHRESVRKLSSFSNQLIYHRWRRRLKNLRSRVLQGLKAKGGPILRASSHPANDCELLQIIENLICDKVIRTVLIIGGSRDSDNTVALLIDFLRKDPARVIHRLKLGGTSPEEQRAQYHGLKTYSPEELAQIVKRIKVDSGVGVFDLILIGGVEFQQDFTPDLGLEQELGEAHFVLVLDTYMMCGYRLHQRLLADPNYVLVTDDPRHGYAIFEKEETGALRRNVVGSTADRQ